MKDIDAAHERALIVKEEFSNRLAERMNRAFYTLSIVAAIILPLGLLTILLGINVGGIPGTESPRGFDRDGFSGCSCHCPVSMVKKKSNGYESDHEGIAIEGSRPICWSWEPRAGRISATCCSDPPRNGCSGDARFHRSVSESAAGVNTKWSCL